VFRQSDPLRELSGRIQKALNQQADRIARVEKTVEGVERHIASRNARSEVDQAMADLQRREEHYTQVIMLAGYGAFFALWTQSKAEMTLWLFASTGALICVSLLTFVGFELYKSWRMAALFAPGKRPTVAAINAEVDRINPPWRWAFFLSAGSGLLAGGSLLLWFVFKTIVAAAHLVHSV